MPPSASSVTAGVSVTEILPHLLSSQAFPPSAGRLPFQDGQRPGEVSARPSTQPAGPGSSRRAGVLGLEWSLSREAGAGGCLRALACGAVLTPSVLQRAPYRSRVCPALIPRAGTCPEYILCGPGRCKKQGTRWGRSRRSLGLRGRDRQEQKHKMRLIVGHKS